eukprot:TRINITY_DN377_c0_g2_i1.p1 TRINITY_DN377_c0_g2~~TRINITY_DN377_c0_g2_i1.p1  ORF type:complete len:230 (-),score=20.69 TRINITY_DN377_c0_g2_i1:142-831(-)
MSTAWSQKQSLIRTDLLPRPFQFATGGKLVTQSLRKSFWKRANVIFNVSNEQISKTKQCQSAIKKQQFCTTGAMAAALVFPLDALLSNTVLVSGLLGWFFAQFAKIFTRQIETGKFDLMVFFDSGGMPSSHSSLTVAVTTSIAILHGFQSSMFALAFCFTSIVMYDAAGVRRHAGKQAEVLNKIIQLTEQDPPLTEKKLKEVLGHTPVQVFSGAVVGLVVTLIYHFVFL